MSLHVDDFSGGAAMASGKGSLVYIERRTIVSSKHHRLAAEKQFILMVHWRAQVCI